MRSFVVPWGSWGVFIAILLVNQFANVGATTGFALSGRSHDFHRFLLWQIIGGLFGLGAQLTFAGMVRYSNVALANSAGIGLAFVSAQVFSAYYFFHTVFSAWQWAGTVFVFVGVLFIALG